MLHHRTQLLEKLVSSYVETHNGNDSEPSARYRTLLASAEEIVRFHTFLDTHPDHVEVEWMQMMGRISDHAQHEKLYVLQRLRDLLFTCQVTSTERDFHHRVMSFLMSAAGRVLSTETSHAVVDRIGTAIEASRESEKRILRDIAEEDEDSEDDWWKTEIPLSPGDDLSEWSFEDVDSTGSIITSPKFVSPRQRSLNSPTASARTIDRHFPPENHSIDDDPPGLSVVPENDPLTLVVPRGPQTGTPNQVLVNKRLVRLRPSKPSTLTNDGKLKHPYGLSSLSLSMASNDAEANHPTRILDPRKCFAESEIVRQILRMFEGLDSPGEAFRWEAAHGMYRVAPGVHTAAVTERMASRLLGGYAEMATRLRKVIEICNAIVNTGTLVDSYSRDTPSGHHRQTRASELGRDDASGGVSNDRSPCIDGIENLRRVPAVVALASFVLDEVHRLRDRLVELQRTTDPNISLLELEDRWRPCSHHIHVIESLVQQCTWKGDKITTTLSLIKGLYEWLERNMLVSGSGVGAEDSRIVALAMVAAGGGLMDMVDDCLSAEERGAIAQDRDLNIDRYGGTDGANNRWAEPMRRAGLSFLADLMEEAYQAGFALSCMSQMSRSITDMDYLLFCTQTPRNDSKGTANLPIQRAASHRLLSLLLARRTLLSPDPDAAQETTSSFDDIKRQTPGRTSLRVSRSDSRIQGAATAGSLTTGDRAWPDYAAEWTEAVSREAAHLQLPVQEDLPALMSLPKSAWDLPSAVNHSKSSPSPPSKLKKPDDDRFRDAWREFEAEEDHLGHAMRAASLVRRRQNRREVFAQLEKRWIPRTLLLEDGSPGEASEISDSILENGASGGDAWPKNSDRGSEPNEVQRDDGDDSLFDLARSRYQWLECDVPKTLTSIEPRAILASWDGDAPRQRWLADGAELKNRGPSTREWKTRWALMDPEVWERAPNLHLVAEAAFLQPLTKSIRDIQHTACRAMVEDGLRRQLHDMLRMATMSAPSLQPFVDMVLDRCGASSGTDGISVLEIDSAFRNAVSSMNEDPDDIHHHNTIRRTSVREVDVELLPLDRNKANPSPPDADGFGLERVRDAASLARLWITMQPCPPLRFLASERFTAVHRGLCSMSLQIRLVHHALAGVRSTKRSMLEFASRRVAAAVSSSVAARNPQVEDVQVATGSRSEAKDRCRTKAEQRWSVVMVQHHMQHLIDSFLMSSEVNLRYAINAIDSKLSDGSMYDFGAFMDGMKTYCDLLRTSVLLDVNCTDTEGSVFNIRRCFDAALNCIYQHCAVMHRIVEGYDAPDAFNEACGTLLEVWKEFFQLKDLLLRLLRSTLSDGGETDAPSIRLLLASLDVYTEKDDA